MTTCSFCPEKTKGALFSLFGAAKEIPICDSCCQKVAQLRKVEPPEARDWFVTARHPKSGLRLCHLGSADCLMTQKAAEGDARSLQGCIEDGEQLEYRAFQYSQGVKE